jgi:hypothetical protein
MPLSSTKPRRGKLIDYTQRGRCLDKQESYPSTSSSFRSIQPVCRGHAERRLSNYSSSSEDVLPILDLAFEEGVTMETADAQQHRASLSQDQEDQEEHISFYLKIPSKETLRASNANKSDLRERFSQRRGNSSKKGIIQSILDNAH